VYCLLTYGVAAHTRVRAATPYVKRQSTTRPTAERHTWQKYR